MVKEGRPSRDLKKRVFYTDNSTAEALATLAAKKALAKQALKAGKTTIIRVKTVVGCMLRGRPLSEVCKHMTKVRNYVSTNADDECIATSENARASVTFDAGISNITNGSDIREYVGKTDRTNANQRFEYKDGKTTTDGQIWAPTTTPPKIPMKVPPGMFSDTDQTNWPHHQTLDPNTRKMVFVKFKPDFMGECGRCWLCGEMVYYYQQIDNKGYSIVTGCGDCEHPAAIVGGILSNTLIANNPDNPVSNFVAHPHCNRWKLDTIPMKFSIEKLWEFDRVVSRILARIIRENELHKGEPDPFFKAKHTNKTLKTENAMITYMDKHVQLWLTEANKGLTSLSKNQRKLIVPSVLTHNIINALPASILVMGGGGGDSEMDKHINNQMEGFIKETIMLFDGNTEAAYIEILSSLFHIFNYLDQDDDSTDNSFNAELTTDYIEETLKKVDHVLRDPNNGLDNDYIIDNFNLTDNTVKLAPEYEAIFEKYSQMQQHRNIQSTAFTREEILGHGGKPSNKRKTKKQRKQSKRISNLKKQKSRKTKKSKK